MNNFLRKLYLKISEPLYARLYRDLSITLNDQVTSHIDFLERFVQEVLSDLLKLNVQLENQAKVLRQLFPDYELDWPPDLTLGETGLTVEQISQLVADTTSERSMMELAAKHNVSPLVVARLRARLYGLNVQALREITRLDRENALLMRALAAEKPSAACAHSLAGEAREG